MSKEYWIRLTVLETTGLFPRSRLRLIRVCFLITAARRGTLACFYWTTALYTIKYTEPALDNGFAPGKYKNINPFIVKFVWDQISKKIMKKFETKSVRRSTKIVSSVVWWQGQSGSKPNETLILWLQTFWKKNTYRSNMKI